MQISGAINNIEMPICILFLYKNLLYDMMNKVDSVNAMVFFWKGRDMFCKKAHPKPVTF